jgi:cobalt-zinc-cadmium resistance protein CzcA
VDVATAPYLNAMRTISLFGLSDVKLQFTYDLTYEEAEQKVLNRLSQLPALQNQAQPTISPWSPTGEIYRYQLVGPPGYSVMDLKTLQDWVLARRFRAVPGVIDVTGWGGKTKTFEIQIDREKLVAYGLTLPQVLQTLNNSNINVGGNTVNIGQQSAVIRGVGLIRSMSDIRNTMLTAANGNPVFLSDIAEIIVGNKPRLGIAGRDEQDDIVQGIVLMRRGQQSLPTIRRVYIGFWHSRQLACSWRSRCLRPNFWASNSCRIWRRAISGFAQPCRLRFRSRRATTSSTAYGW